MEIEFTVGEPGSVRVTVRAMIDSQEGLDKVVAALGAARQLLPSLTKEPEGVGDGC